MTMDEFEQTLGRILQREPRYARQAYLFVFEGLAHTQRRLGEHRHVSGRELLFGIRELALAQFGGLSRFVLAEWGITSTRDIGEIVFLLVEHSLMGRTESDRIEDFVDVFEFDDAFRFDATPSPEAPLL